MRNIPNRLYIILVVFLLQITTVFAEPAPPPPSTPPPPPPGLPLDGVIVILIGASIYYGIYKLKKLNNIKKASN